MTILPTRIRGSAFELIYLLLGAIDFMATMWTYRGLNCLIVSRGAREASAVCLGTRSHVRQVRESKFQMPLQNRVTPESVIEAVSSRGMFMGNRGCLHGSERNLLRQFCSEKRWIICETEFRGRRRPLMEPGKYTELFFLDEATALAAGHRPCGECRRDRFRDFKIAWTRGNSELGLNGKCGITEVDKHLHFDRLTNERTKRTHQCRLGELPDGVFVRYSANESPHLWFGHKLFPWSHEGYRAPIRCGASESVVVLTPASTVNAMREGYSPVVSPCVASFLSDE